MQLIETLLYGVGDLILLVCLCLLAIAGVCVLLRYAQLLHVRAEVERQNVRHVAQGNVVYRAFKRRELKEHGCVLSGSEQRIMNGEV